MEEWIRSSPIWLLGLVLFLASIASACAGATLSLWMSQLRGEGGELLDSAGYIVCASWQLLALPVAFTFGLAMDRYQHRKQLVVQEATAIEAVYLKAQLLDEPIDRDFGTC